MGVASSERHICGGTKREEAALQLLWVGIDGSLFRPYLKNAGRDTYKFKQRGRKGRGGKKKKRKGEETKSNIDKREQVLKIK